MLDGGLDRVRGDATTLVGSAALVHGGGAWRDPVRFAMAGCAGC